MTTQTSLQSCKGCGRASFLNQLAVWVGDDPFGKSDKKEPWHATCYELSHPDPRDAEIERYRAALQRLADCDWVITPMDRMDAVRKIARDALGGYLP
ncbi:MAG: hypothetical protein ACRYGR_09020 [Janthinobacterium lividum]